MRILLSCGWLPHIGLFNLVALGMAFGEEPELATGAVVPPFFLHTHLVVTHVNVVGPVGFGDVKRPSRSRIIFAAVTKFLSVATAAIGAVNRYHRSLSINSSRKGAKTQRIFSWRLGVFA